MLVMGTVCFDPHVLQARPTPRDVTIQPQTGSSAAVRLVEVAQEHEGRLVVIALGPLTNVALACKLDPAFPQRIKQLVVMGGSESVSVCQSRIANTRQSCSMCMLYACATCWILEVTKAKANAVCGDADRPTAAIPRVQLPV